MTWITVLLRDVPCYALEIAFFKQLLCPALILGWSVPIDIQVLLCLSPPALGVQRTRRLLELQSGRCMCT